MEALYGWRLSLEQEDTTTGAGQAQYRAKDTFKRRKIQIMKLKDTIHGLRYILDE